MAGRSGLGSVSWRGAAVLLLGQVLAVSLQTSQARQLRFVTVVYRHGDRSPVRSYPKDPYQESAWPRGFGQLTQIGMKQHWDLGQALRERYKGFLNESYDRREIYVRSTDVDRTLMSAESNLAGLYPPEGSEVFLPNLTWQPIPVHTVPESEDRILKFPILPCPKYTKLQEETRHSPEYVNMMRDNLNFLQMVANETGLSDCSLESAWSISDVLFCEKKHNLSLPSWATPEVVARLVELKDFSFRFLFGIIEQEKKARLQGGVLVAQILKNMTAAAHNASSGLKLIAYSSHDTTLGALQMALNVYNGKQAPYASCHMFELYEENPGNFTVEMYFRNDSSRPPYPLTLPGCVRSCPLDKFQDLLQKVITKDWEKECQLSSSSKDTAIPPTLVPVSDPELTPPSSWRFLSHGICAGAHCCINLPCVSPRLPAEDLNCACARPKIICGPPRIFRYSDGSARRRHRSHYRTGRLWMHPFFAHRPPTHSSFPAEITTDWLPARFRYGRGTQLRDRHLSALMRKYILIQRHKHCSSNPKIRWRFAILNNP